MTRIYQKHLQPVLLQNVINGEPVNTGGLHRYRLDPARFQPCRHSFQICRPTSKLPYRLRIPPRGHRNEVAFISNIDSGGVRMHHVQSRIIRIQPSLQILPLFAVPARQSFIRQMFPSPFQSLLSCSQTRRSARLAINSQTLQRGRDCPDETEQLATK